jgi:hypothetical protein
LTTKIAAQATLEADARLAEAGAAALSTSAEPVDSAVFARLFRHPDECVVRAALESALVRRSPLAPRRAAALCEEGRADYAGAARVVAIASGPEAADLLRRAGASGSVTALEALGWYGNAAVIDDLLDHMEGETAEAAVTGLQLITGASLTDAGALPAGAEPFTAAEGPVPPQAILSTDPAAWRDWWKEHGKAAKADVRYRFGHTYGLEDDLGQIEAPHATEAERRIAYLELCARSGGTLPFDAGAFVARQRRQIADWSAHLAQKRGARGGWPVRLERS